MYFANPAFDEPDQTECLETFKTPEEAAGRYRQEIAWTEEWAREGQQPIAITLEPGKKKQTLLVSRSWWVVDGVGF